MADQAPLPFLTAWPSIGRCVLASVRLLASGRVHRPRTRVGQWLRFADGSAARVYRETVIDRPSPSEPAVLVVAFRLRAVRGRSHDLFRRESLLNTPLFVGFPGLVSKLWMANDEHGSIEGSTSGTELSKPSTTRAPCGGSWPWSAFRAQSATTYCRGCCATTCYATRCSHPLTKRVPGGG
jgi:hypothetical protein